MTLYAVGDIHGHIEKLERALALIEADGGGRIVFVGDLVDRGPDARAVIERLMQGQGEGRDWIVLLGNHDRMFLRFVRDGEAFDPAIKSGRSWLDPHLGGLTTLGSYAMAGPGFLRAEGGGLEALRSYDVGTEPARAVAEIAEEARRKVPASHLDWLASLPLTHEEGDLLFVHAGLLPNVALSAQTEDDLLWIREGFLDWPRPFGRLVVHGHTPVEEPIDYGNRVAIDSGAAFGRPLVPVAFEGTEAFALGEGGRTPLRPPRGAPGWR